MNVHDGCGSGLSRESSRDDINSECDQHFEVEQRFRVDRKRLEALMTNSSEVGEAAQEFFDKIGTETETCVIWPSRYFTMPMFASDLQLLSPISYFSSFQVEDRRKE